MKQLRQYEVYLPEQGETAEDAVLVESSSPLKAAILMVQNFDCNHLACAHGNMTVLVKVRPLMGRWHSLRIAGRLLPLYYKTTE